jgi:tetratricopeptide (TPR) repeat protein
LSDALAFYRAAAQADPGYFEAFSSLGSAASDLGDVAQAARAYELAVAVRPESFDARFNFGLALKRANYIVDASQELERLLASSPAKESPARLAMLHLTLGNLYAQEFNQPALARAHYLKVLELDPANSQGTAIRFWLQGHP